MRSSGTSWSCDELAAFLAEVSADGVRLIAKSEPEYDAIVKLEAEISLLMAL